MNRIFYAAITSMVAVVGMPAMASHIDFVVDGGFILSTTSTLGSASDTQTGDAGNILGTEREVMLDFASGSGILSTGTINAPTGPGPVGANENIELLFDNSVNSVGTLTLTYDGVGSAGLGGLDFDSMWNFIAVSFSAVQGEGDLTLEVADTSSNTGLATIAVDSAGTYVFDFLDSGFTGVDFALVDRVTVKLTTTLAASDFAITQITRERFNPNTIVPEPTAVALLVLASFGGLLAVRQ